MMFIFVLAKNVLLCHFILFVFPPQKYCNYCTSQTVDSIIENGSLIKKEQFIRNVTPAKYVFISDFLKKLDVGHWPCKSYSYRASGKVRGCDPALSTKNRTISHYSLFPALCRTFRVYLLKKPISYKISFENRNKCDELCVYKMI